MRGRPLALLWFVVIGLLLLLNVAAFYQWRSLAGRGSRVTAERTGLGNEIRAKEGEIVALLGANGAGKSTTLRVISGLMPPQSGGLRFSGGSIAGLSPRAIVKLGVAHVPEGRRVFPGLTVRENIILGGSNRERPARAELEADAEQMFGIFPEIKPFENALGWTLSGGQLQMVAVARGLMAKPRLLLLDEPSLGLAPIVMQAVFQIVSEIQTRGTTVLLVEQNAHMALNVANWGYVLETGRLTLGGERSEVSILFSDIRGFTRMSATMEPDDVVDMLNAYFAALVEAIFRCEGTVDKFIGDAILAVFGSPDPDPEHHRQALHAAVLGFDHPMTGERLLFRREPPADLSSALLSLRRGPQSPRA